MTDVEQKIALEWLDGMMRVDSPAPPPNAVRTLKAMLAEPRLPKEPSDEALDKMIHYGGWDKSQSVRRSFEESYRALYAHLTKPKTKTVWRVEHTDGRCLRGVDEYDDQSVALAEVTRLINDGSTAYIWRKEVSA